MACKLYDSSEMLQKESLHAYKGGFPSAVKWMRLALQILRSKEIPERNIPYSFLGFIKYGLAGFTFILYIIFIIHIKYYIFLPFAIVLFYGIEVQFLFLFPLAIDGISKPIYHSLNCKVKGGRFASIFGVIVIAIFMISGILPQKSFFRNWSVGCIAVLIWYEDSKDILHD